MSIYEYKVGLGHVGSYQVGGKPYLTGTLLLGAGPNNGEVKISFPTVTKNVLITNTSASVPIRVHYNSATALGNVISGHHYFTLEDKKDSVSLGNKCKEIYISLETAGTDGSFELVADLTGISSNEMFSLTGSGLTD
tara:strand:- start:73 stop:483 length:411 start_codon:yes stop_codon:yes gene_type:complete